MTTIGITALTAPTEFARAADGVTYAYRRFGAAGDVPLLMLQHFRGNIDNWDPALHRRAGGRARGHPRRLRRRQLVHRPARA